MEELDGLSRRELLALKEIHLIGRTTDRTIALQLYNDDMIIDSQDCDEWTPHPSPECRAKH